MTTNHPVSVTWLGQAGLWLALGSTSILIDPYLSDSVGEIDPSKHRRVPVETRFLEQQPDILICTHDHLDHTDPATLCHFLERRPSITVLAPGRAWERVRAFGNGHNYVQLNRFSQWSEGDVRICAVPAAHSDPDAIGVLLHWAGRTLYITGDTLYNRQVLDEVPAGVDAVFLPINGEGNNMNAVDAARFARDIGAQCVIPVHWGMLDSISPQLPDCGCAVTIPTLYEEMVL